MKSQDNLFEEGDPFDDPAWKAAKTPTQAPDFVGCPMAWLEQVLPHIQGASQLAVALLLYRQWVLCGRRRTFDFPNSGLKRVGIKRSVKSRALDKLKDANLIAIEQLGGHAVRITRRWR
jgi:DNA-binding transcriptional ArsR family regulator